MPLFCEYSHLSLLLSLLALLIDLLKEPVVLHDLCVHFSHWLSFLLGLALRPFEDWGVHSDSHLNYRGLLMHKSLRCRVHS